MIPGRGRLSALIPILHPHPTRSLPRPESIGVAAVPTRREGATGHRGRRDTLRPVPRHPRSRGWSPVQAWEGAEDTHAPWTRAPALWGSDSALHRTFRSLIAVARTESTWRTEMMTIHRAVEPIFAKRVNTHLDQCADDCSNPADTLVGLRIAGPTGFISVPLHVCSHHAQPWIDEMNEVEVRG